VNNVLEIQLCITAFYSYYLHSLLYCEDAIIGIYGLLPNVFLDK